MTTSTLKEMFRRLVNGEGRTRAARTVEYFGWLDLVLGLIILLAPRWTAALLRLPQLGVQDANYLHLVGALVSALGMLYVVSGRLNSQGFIAASLLDRPLVPAVMAVLWWRHILPGPLAVAFSVSDFGGFLWTLSAGRADTRMGLNVGGPELREQSRAARVVEALGWLEIAAGAVILLAPYWTASLLHLPSVVAQGPNYFRLAGLLVGGLGTLYLVSGSLSAHGAIFASVLVRPIVGAILVVLWFGGILPGRLALASSVVEFGGFLWTLSAWQADVRSGAATGRVPLLARWVAGFFGLVTGVVRNARTFHPDGRVFRGAVRSLQPADPGLARVSEQLAGSVLMRIGMGVMKKGAPRWLADRIPDAPSIASRFFTASTPDEIRLQRHPGEDLDLLCTAGGDRLWTLLLNLATGGKRYGLHQFDYFQNVYSADVPYKIDDGRLDVWLRLVPDVSGNRSTPGSPQDGTAREQGLTDAVASHAVVRIEVQRAGDPREPFVPIAEIRFEEEIQLDQELLHFDPIDGRGFEPHGLVTGVRRIVYPTSVRSRGASQPERARRDHESAFRRLARYLNERPITPHAQRRWIGIALFAVLAIIVVLGLCLAERFTGNR
jgi:hypothetical protein